MGIIYLFPYLNKTIPSPLVCIIVLTAISMWLPYGRAHRG